MAKTTFVPPIFSMTDAERQALQERSMQAPIFDADLQDFSTTPFAGEVVGAQASTVGTALTRASMAVGRTFSPTTAPLNLTVGIDEASRGDYDVSVFAGNNPESIAQDLNDIPASEWPWLLSSEDWGTYQDRKLFLKMRSPEAQKMATTAGYAMGLAADIGVFTTLGLAAEPLALAGLGTRTTMASQVMARSVGAYRTQTPAVAVAEAVASVSRTNLAARYAALGVGEEAVFQATKNAVDPTYDPTFGEAMFDFVVSGTTAGLIGGAAFGRHFVKENIEAAVRDFRTMRTVDLPGGYKINYNGNWGFDSPVAADKMLFAPGTGNLQFEADRIAGDLWVDWSKAPGNKADFFIPGTRTTPIGAMEVGAAKPMRVRVGETQGLRSAIKAAAFELSLAGMKLDKDVFSKVAQVLVNVDQKKLKGATFNKAFWDELLGQVDPEVAGKVRKMGQRTMINGIDKTVFDTARREDMVTSVFEAFRTKQHLEPGVQPSLIFRVLQEVKDRGGSVNRAAVSAVIDELRVIAQNPPKRTNAKGVQVLDTLKRRAQVYEVINKRVTNGKDIFIPPTLIQRMSTEVAAKLPSAAAVSVSQAVGGTAADASDVPVNRVRLPWWDRMGNQSALLHQAKNGWARLIGNHAFFARRDMGEAQAHTIFEWGSQKLYATTAMFIKGYRNGFVRFALGGGTENVGTKITIGDQLVTAFKSRKMLREFDARVVKQLRTGAFDDSVDAVNETARGLREMFNRIHELAHSVGLSGFQKSAVANYMPRMWRWDRIRTLATTAKGKKTLEALIRQSIDQDGRRVVIDGVEEAFEGDIDAAAKVFTERLIAIAQGTENAPLVSQEQELFDAIVELGGPMKEKSGSRSPFGRARILLNEQAATDAGEDLLAMGKTGLSIADLTHDDLPYVFHKYVTSIMGSINLKRMVDAFNDELRARGVLSPEFLAKKGLTQKDVQVENVSQMIGLARKLGGAIEPEHEEAIRELMSAISYEPLHHGRTKMTDKILPMIQSYGYLVTGGQFGLAAMGEVSRIVATLGVGNTVRQIPLLLEMVSNFKNLDTEQKNLASAIDSWFSPSTDRLRRAFSSYWDGSRDLDRGKFLNNALQSSANFLSDVSLLAPVTSFTQHLTAAATLQHLWEAAVQGGKRLDESTLRTLGMTQERYDNLIQWIGRNAVTEKRFLGERVVDLKSVDSREMVELAQLVDRMVRTRIQDLPTRGDFHKSMFSFVGKLLTQFRTFNLKGIDNFLLQNASRMANGSSATKVQVLSEIGATMMFAGLIQYMRSYGDYKSFEAAGNREKMEELEAQMDLAGFIRGAMTGPSEFFVPALLTDFAWTKLADKDPLFSPYRYSGLTWYGFPAMAVASRVDSVFEDVYGSSVAKTLGLDLERETTSSTLHKARLLLPFQNLPGLKQYFNIKEKELSDDWDLLEEQPRRRRK